MAAVMKTKPNLGTVDMEEVCKERYAWKKSDEHLHFKICQSGPALVWFAYCYHSINNFENSLQLHSTESTPVGYEQWEQDLREVWT